MFKKEENLRYFEVSDGYENDDLPNDAWKIRPCEWYKEEYKDCKGFRARFHQYFIHGETVDCSQWKIDFDNCMQFRKKKDLKCMECVMSSEDKRKKERENASSENDVWEYRTEPPNNWNSTMPDWMLEDKKNSLLIDTQNRLNEGKSLEPIFTGFRCTIM
ncbi:hypothetical protein JTE90_026407 [Oedothorax gibbosus]|uniref:Synaptic plasticity regulator PANTS n=1 Tax=Oedothorax gibbosus TaxID=931172 RepID=A0AAV6VE01_9ARAC|nr:hypothetical protein JTE90_026407 [Oedothorax gibbosus]